jgi:hypothetical protein
MPDKTPHQHVEFCRVAGIAPTKNFAIAFPMSNEPWFLELSVNKNSWSLWGFPSPAAYLFLHATAC